MKNINWSRIGRSTLICLLIALIPMSLIGVLPLFVGQYPDTGTLLTGAAASLIFGVVIYFVGVFTGRLQKRVGTITGLAALAGIAAIVGTVLAMVLPTCPGGVEATACTTSESASWGMVLALLVILFTMLWVIVTGSIDFTKWAHGKFTDQLTKRKANKEGETQKTAQDAPERKEKQDAR